jgi:hypothetical protein
MSELESWIDSELKRLDNLDWIEGKKKGCIK